MRRVIGLLLALSLWALLVAAVPALAATGDAWTPPASVTFPASLAWEQTSSSVSVTATNTGTNPWTSTYGLSEVGTLTDALKRWTTGGRVAVSGAPIAVGGTATFAASLVAPPLTTLKYELPATPTSVPVIDSLPTRWNMDDGAGGFLSLTSGSLPSGTIAVSRFTDIQGNGFLPYIEELGGAVPAIVQGYSDQTYRPALTVTRDQLAVYVQRALQLTLLPVTGAFSDVSTTYWAGSQIEACARAGIVSGYSTGALLPEYRPGNVVTRDQMAVFIARALAGNDSKVPAGPSAATFTDVPSTNWAYKYIEYLKAQGVVNGTSPTTYNPADVVSRDAMAKFIFNALLRPAPAWTGIIPPVVLGGPAITQVNPSTAAWYGWPSSVVARGASPGYAYCVFDALRLTSKLATKGSGGNWNVTFELWTTSTSILIPATKVLTTTVTVTSTQISNAITAAQASGVPYLTVSAQLPVLATTNSAGSYQLQVTVGDGSGTVQRLSRQPTYYIP